MDLNEEEFHPWVNVAVPGQEVGPPTSLADVWTGVDTLGAWDCGLCSLQTLEEVPLAFRTKYSRVVARILERLQQASTEKDETRALSCFYLFRSFSFGSPSEG